MKELQHINKYFYKYRYKLIFGIIITIGAKVFALFTPRLIGRSINVISDAVNGKISNEVFKHELALNILYLIAAAIIAGILTFFMRQLIINVSRYIEFDLKNEIYKQYQNLSLSFYKSNRTGDLMNRISEDVRKVRMYLGPSIMYGLSMITLFAMLIPYMFSINAELTLYALIPLPVLSVSIYYVNNIINKRSEEIQISQSGLSTFVQEAFSGIRVLKSFTRENDSIDKFSFESNEYKEKSLGLT